MFYHLWYSMIMKSKKDPLLSVLGNEIRSTLLRLFIFDKERIFTSKEIQKIIKKKITSIQSELKNLEKEGLVCKKKFTKAQKNERGSRESGGFVYNSRYIHRNFLESMVESSTPSERDLLAKKISRVPGIRILITTDIFNDNAKNDVDIVIASNKNNDILLQEKIQEVEREIGKELKCSLLSVNDFVFRVETRDKFLREVFDGEYIVHIDRIGIFND